MSKNNLERNREQREKNIWWQPSMMMFLRLSVWIAAPVILATFLGRWLDRKFDSEPWLFVICVGSAFILSMVGLVVETGKEYKRIAREEKGGEDGPDQSESNK